MNKIINEFLKINPELDLMFERNVDVPCELVWKAWTDPKHLVEWFTPKPWKTTDCFIDLRPGGEFRTIMQSPEGEKFDNSGCYLEIINEQLLVWTDALQPGFRPSTEGFFTGIIILEKTTNGTKYTAIAKHKSIEDCKKHAEMGFVEGWGTALNQLVEFIKSNNQ
ncbi:SRPBCC family protein [Leptospira sp. GIMC2001]|uniref:SRPBCC family protein n=1 Tax=Leptospira sp. GIMC2001 TaxID=1513297 RepID=UPI00234AF569|nr:SRPBCC family protein [Leptospira sp. GIMC2001]WCL49123.1 SRPBCC family protein [Leptospira sp. GIMC2001]